MAPTLLRPAVLCALATALGLGVGVGYTLGHRPAAGTSPDLALTRALPATTSLSGSRSLGGVPPAEAPLPAVLAISTAPATPATEAQACLELTALAAKDPAAALRRAQSAPTPRERELFRNAALQGWATRDPLAAADWTLANVRYDERRTAIEALATGAIAQPETAVRVIGHLIAADPVLACDHGNALVTAFAHAGLYKEASQFAATGPAEYRAAWLSTTYQQWATYQPQAALLALETIADPASRQEARGGLYAGWSSSDPASLVAHAQTLPHGDSRLEALNDGLSQWVHRDPAAASAWMDNHDPSPDLDVGAAAIALAPALVSQKPDIAASWAESITDPELRASTLLDLIRLWAERDPASARRYAATSPLLRPDTRALALSTLDSSP